MLKILQALKYSDSNDLHDLHNLSRQFSNSIKRLAIAAEKREHEKKLREQRKLSDQQKEIVRKLRLQRAIMTRYQAGYSYNQIAGCLGYHPKTIARYIRKFQTDISILQGLETDLDREKVILIKGMIKKGMTKPEIARQLHCSLYLV